jgi:hypothetical protein
MESKLAYIAINPNGDFYFESCRDEIELTIEHVSHQTGLDKGELISLGWKFSTIIIKP